MVSDSSNTNQLLHRARAGDTTAFTELFARHEPQLKQFIQRRMDVRLRSRLDASDVLQDTHMEAFRRFADFYDRRPMPFHLWLCKNAYERLLNLRRDHITTQRRSIVREQSVLDPSSHAIASAFVDQLDSPSEQVSKLEFRQRVAELVRQLPDIDQEVLLLRNVEGHSHQDIACILDIEPAAARKRYARALVKLERLLVESDLLDE
ncbi:MAG: sigma-70 family RNA polymerase sigma factor [Pirellulaceae bacterium]